MISDDRFLGKLRDYLVELERRPLPIGSESRVSAAVAPALRRSHSPSHWLAPRLRRPVIAVVLVASVAIAAGVYMTRGTVPASVDHAALMVAIQPAGTTLDCRLAISALSQDHTTGFIDLRSGRGGFNPVKTAGTTYIPALGRWADTLPQMVAPDGLSYVYADSAPESAAIHIVDASGDRVLARAAPFVSAFAFTRSGVLLLDSSDNAHREAGILAFKLMDPITGAVRDLAIPPLRTGALHSSGASSETGYVRSGDTVWTSSNDPVTNVATLWRYDLASGATAEWYNGVGDGKGNLQVIGADRDGNPVVQVSSTDLFHTDPAKRNGISEKTMLLTAPHQMTVLNSGVVGQPGVAGNLSPLSVTDGDRIWIGSDDGQVWVYTRGSAMQLVAKVTTSTHGAPGLAISGPCL